MPENATILFDGVCNLCNGFVNFVIDRDPGAKFKFGSLQSPEAAALLREVAPALSTDPTSSDAMSTVILVEDGIVYTRSSAVLRILRHLGGAWPASYGFIIIPAFIRDFVYGIISRYRYRLFGKRDVCRIPTPELKARFISQ